MSTVLVGGALIGGGLTSAVADPEQIGAGEGGTRRISGTVTGADPSEPISDFVVEVFDADHGHVDLAWSGDFVEPGYYEFDLPAGEYVLLFTDEEYVYTQAYYDGVLDFGSATVITLDEGADITVDMALDPGAALTGVVTAADTGEPIPNTCVDVYFADSFDHASRGCTNADGQYSAGGLVEGVEYKVNVGEWNEYLETWLFGADSFAEADIITAPDTLDVELQRGGHIDGVVTDPDGEPAQDVEVWVHPADDQFDPVYNDWTDEDGRFWGHPLPPGEYKVEFVSSYGGQWATGRRSFETADVIVVGPGERTLLEEELVVDSGDLVGAISGTITTAGSSEPIGGACATARDEGDEFEACAGANGEYTIEAPVGAYIVKFSDPSGWHQTTWYGSDDPEEAPEVVVFEDEETSGIDGALTPAGALDGRVADRVTGEPIEGVCVYAHSSAFEVNEGQDTECSDSDGVWRISELAAGEVRLHTWGTDTYAERWFEDAATWEDATVLEVVAGDATSLDDFLLSPGGTIAGVVTGEDGEPIEGACVILNGIQHSRAGGCDGAVPGNGAISDADGRYEVISVAAGDQVLGVAVFSSSDYAWMYNGGAATKSDAPPVPVESGETTTVDFILPPTALLTVSSELAIPVEMDVYTKDGDAIGSGGYVEPDGEFTMWGLPTSAVRVNVLRWDDDAQMWHEMWFDAADSFDSATPIDVVSGEETTITLTSKCADRRSCEMPPVMPPWPPKPVGQGSL